MEDFTIHPDPWSLDVIFRYWARVDTKAGPGDCWGWTGKQHRFGYGVISVEGNTYGAHVLSWELVHGRKRPKGMHICHHCDNPICTFPEHLYLGTPQQNNRDRDLRERIAWGEEHPLAKLTNAQAAEIRERYQSGKWTQKDLAKEYGLSAPSISKVVLGKSYVPLAIKAPIPSTINRGNGETPTTKRCSHCNELLPLDQFGIAAVNRRKGRRTYCLKCEYAIRRQRRLADPAALEEHRRYQRDWARARYIKRGS